MPLGVGACKNKTTPHKKPKNLKGGFAMERFYISWERLIELAKEGQDITLLLEKALLSYDLVFVKEGKEIPIFCYEDLYDLVEQILEEVES